MPKIVGREIASCIPCPHRLRRDGKWICNHGALSGGVSADKTLPLGGLNFPAWCPLPDTREARS